MHDFSNREVNSLYVHQGFYQDATSGSSNIQLTPEQVINGLYVIESDGGNMIVPTAADICNYIPDNVKRNNVTFRFTVVNNYTFNITMEPNTGVTFYPAGNITIHKDKSYEVIFRIVSMSLQLVDVYLLGFT